MSNEKEKKDSIVVEPVKVESTPEDLEKIVSKSSNPNEVESTSEPILIEVDQVPETPHPKKEKVTLEEILNQAEETLKEEGEEPTDEEVAKSNKFLNGFMNYVKGDSFDNKCEELSSKYNVPKKQVAKSFINKALGTISDLLHIAIGAIEDTASALLTLIHNIINGGIRIACNLARNLARLITFNQTAKA